MTSGDTRIGTRCSGASVFPRDVHWCARGCARVVDSLALPLDAMDMQRDGKLIETKRGGEGLPKREDA